MPNRVQNIPEGIAGIRKTLGIMATYVRASRTDQIIRQLALQIVAPLMPKDWHGQIDALFYFVQQNIRYVSDPNTVEMLQTPQATLHLESGDCASMSVLLASLLEVIGYETAFVACGSAPNFIEHVFVRVLPIDSDEWVSLDVTESEPPGWEPPNQVTQIVFPV